MESLSPSTINVRLSAVRKMVTEARRNGMIGHEEAADLIDIPNIPQRGTRLGNWLTRDQAKELLAVPDRSTLKGNGITSSWLSWSAAPSGGMKWPSLKSRRFTSGKEGGSWPISKAKGGASGPLPCRSGLKRESRCG
jgi:hypothetical protein